MLGPLYPLLWVKGQYGTYAKSGGEGFQIGVGWGEELMPYSSLLDFSAVKNIWAKV